MSSFSFWILQFLPFSLCQCLWELLVLLVFLKQNMPLLFFLLYMFPFYQFLFSFSSSLCSNLLTLSPDRGPGPERVCPGPAGSVWVLESGQERFHSTSPGEFEGAFVKVGDSETGRGLAQKKQQESPGGAALAHWEVREKGALGSGSGGQPGTSCHCLLPPWL